MVYVVRLLAAIGVLVGLGFSPAAAQNCNGQFPAGYVCGNKNNATGFPAAASMSSMLDEGIGSTRGSILERGSSAWQAITPGTAGYAFVSNGAGADPSYQPIGGSAFGPQNANTFFSGPISGSAANPTFRVIAPADLTVLPRIVTAAGDVTITNTDVFVALNKSAAASTNFNLPALSTKVGPVTIWDAAGVFNAHTQNVIPAGADTIYGLTSYPMTEAYENLTFYPTTLGWMVGNPR